MLADGDEIAPLASAYKANKLNLIWTRRAITSTFQKHRHRPHYRGGDLFGIDRNKVDDDEADVVGKENHKKGNKIVHWRYKVPGTRIGTGRGPPRTERLGPSFPESVKVATVAENQTLKSPKYY